MGGEQERGPCAYVYIYIDIPVVPHEAVPEVSKK